MRVNQGPPAVLLRSAGEVDDPRPSQVAGQTIGQGQEVQLRRSDPAGIIRVVACTQLGVTHHGCREIVDLEDPPVARRHCQAPQLRADRHRQASLFERLTSCRLLKGLARLDAASWDRPPTFLGFATPPDEHDTSLAVNDHRARGQHRIFHSVRIRTCRLPMPGNLRVSADNDSRVTQHVCAVLDCEFLGIGSGIAPSPSGPNPTARAL